MEKAVKADRNPNILVTGGSGFLGMAIVKEFLNPSSPVAHGMIRIFDMKGMREKVDGDVHFVQGDIRNYEDVNKACTGIDIVIHTASIIDWGTKSEKDVYDVNVEGTRNVINACKENDVGILVYTGSLDAVYTGKPLVDIDESQEYPANPPNMYCKSKCIGEKLVLAENSEEFKTCVLRPSDIYGERDPYHIDSLINMAKGGFYIRLGNGSSKCQHVYVGNMAWAQLMVVRALMDNNKKVEGNVYFITDGPGANFFKFFDKIVLGAGYRIWPKNLWLPRRFAYSLGAISEFFAFIIRPIKHYNPKLSRFAVEYTCTDFTFESDKAKNDFGFIPKYSKEEAFERTVSYYRKDSTN